MKWLKRSICIIIIVVFCAVAIITFLGYQKFTEAIKKVSLDDKIASIENNNSYIKIEDIPEIYIKAVVAVEDHRFYEHGAIDLISIVRALFNNIKDGELSEGGSTITQQIAKNMYFSQDKDFIRKIAEIFMAIEIENNYSKNKILELYVNTCYYGDGYYGIKNACRGYFKKEPIDMSLFEVSLLAGVPNAPSIYAPTQNLELSKKRQKHVINKMLQYGIITEEEAELVIGNG